MSETETFAATTATVQESVEKDAESTAAGISYQYSNGNSSDDDQSLTLNNQDKGASESPLSSGASIDNSSLAEIISSQLESLRAYHSEVIDNKAPEAIHKMRVTTRKLQASLDLLQSNGDESRVRKLKKSLRKWRRVLSTVRNYDVFLGIIEKETAGRKHHIRKRFDPLKSVLEDRRARIAAEAGDYLSGISIDKLAARLGFAVKSNGEENGEDQSRENILFDESRIARRAAERIEQRLAEFLALAVRSHPTTDPADLHQLRIAAKRLRYLLETTTQMRAEDATKALAWLRSLQDKIGDWHDLHAIEEEIISIVTRRKFVSANLEDAAQILQAATHLKKKKEKLAKKILPLRVPRTITSTSLKLAKSLRREYAV